MKGSLFLSAPPANLGPSSLPARPVRAHAIGVALAAAALALVWLTNRTFGGAHLYFPMAAVFLSALNGGLGPGLVTLGACAIGFDFFFLGPPFRLGVATAAEAHQLTGFVLFGFAAVLISARFRSARTSAERARRLAEAAERDARRIGELQERLVAMVSHDLRGPIGSLRVGIQLMPRLGELNDRQRGALERMHGTARRMEALILRLLDVARGRQGNAIPLQLAPATVGDIAARVISEAEAGFPEATVRLAVEGDDRCLLDALRIEQAVSNLVHNALVHGSREAAVEVQVEGHPSEVVLRVRNRGPSIPPAILPQIFEPFRSGSKDGSGLGLGLFIVRECVQAHGGSVAARSSGGETTFEMRLPRQPGDAGQRAAGAAGP